MSSYLAGRGQKCCWWVLQAEESPSPTGWDSACCR